VASKHAINSASIVDAAMTDYFALFHDIAPPAKRNILKNVDFLVSTQLTKFES